MPESVTLPNWAPLEKRLRECHEPDETLTSFMWIRQERGIEFYKHIETGRFLLLDSQEQSWKFQLKTFSLSDFAHDLRYVCGKCER